MPNFNGKYPSFTLVGNCSVCHTFPPTLNPYGAAYKSAGRNTTALTSIQGQDSDGDVEKPYIIEKIKVILKEELLSDPILYFSPGPDLNSF